MTRRVVAIAAVAAAVVVAGAALAQGPAIRVGYRSHIFLVRGDGAVRRLTGGHGGEIQPRWCAHGRRLFDIGHGVELRAVRDGRVLRRFAFRGYVDSVSPAPDCRRFAILTYHGGAVDRLVVVALDGSRRELVPNDVGSCSPYAESSCPVWSPDGRTVYYTRHGAMWAIPSRGGTPRRLVADVYSGPQVAPDGSWLAFTRFDNHRDVSGLWIVRPDGTQQRHLVRGVYVAPTAFGWMPHQRAVFAHGGGVGQRVLVVTPSGHRRRIGRPFHGSLVALSPDGRRIAWTHQRDGKDIQVRTSRIDGSGFRVLARFASKGGLTEIDTLAWSPSGRTLVVEPHRHFGD